MKIRALLIALIPFAVSACGDGTNPFDAETLSLQSGFVTPSASGAFANDITDPEGTSVPDAAGNGYAYQLGGNNTTKTLVARAGILPATSLTAAPTTGTATLNGSFHVRTISNAQLENGVVTGDSSLQVNVLALTADFGATTLTGNTAGLAVIGDFSTGDLTGTVTFGGIAGTLAGKVGATQAVGAFHGASSNAVMAGGFNVSE